MTRSWIAAAALALAGCAAQIMQTYVGRTVQDVMVQYGPPVNAFDMGDGRRAFQWSVSSSYTAPSYVNTQGAAIPIGHSVWWTQNTTITGAQSYNQTCLYTMFARWDSVAGVWRIQGYQKPDLVCA